MTWEWECVGQTDAWWLPSTFMIMPTISKDWASGCILVFPRAVCAPNQLQYLRISCFSNKSIWMDWMLCPPQQSTFFPAACHAADGCSNNHCLNNRFLPSASNCCTIGFFVFQNCKIFLITTRDSCFVFLYLVIFLHLCWSIFTVGS